jgi:alkanesulfonate monooxygenase SsuD/methylene tetrahydromethanopterin reductase-like flavin-dependent oxidoreductase (luciferase family)
MKIGMFMQPQHHAGWDYHEMYDQDVAACLHADAVGFDEVWVGEHYAQRTEPITNALQFLSSLIPITRNLKLGTGVINLTNRNPIQVAGDAAMLDHMSKGRLMLGIGPGGVTTDLELFKALTGKNRQQMMVESHDTIVKIWESDPPYEIKTEYWDVTLKETVNLALHLGPMPKPYQKPHPLFATSAMSRGSGTAKLAGARGWGLISANFNPASVVRTQGDAYRAGAGAAGGVADLDKWRVARSIFVAETDEQAAAYLARPDNTLRRYWAYTIEVFKQLNYIDIFKDDPAMPDSDIDIDYCMDAMVIAGGPETVARKLLELTDEIGRFGTLLTTFHEWDDEALWRNAMDLAANRVIPSVNARLGLTVAA